MCLIRHAETMTERQERQLAGLAAAFAIAVLAVYRLGIGSPENGPGGAVRATTQPPPPVSQANEAQEGSSVGDGCRYLLKTQVESILGTKLVMESPDPTECRLDPAEEKAIGAVYNVGPYNEETYLGLSQGGKPVGGLGEKAAAVEVTPGAQILTKKGDKLIAVIVGGTGSGGFAGARKKAITLTEALLLKI